MIKINNYLLCCSIPFRVRKKNNNITSTTCDVVSFNDWSRTTLSANLYKVKRSFKPCQNEQDLVKKAREKGKKPCKVDPKIHENLEP